MRQVLIRFWVISNQPGLVPEHNVSKNAKSVRLGRQTNDLDIYETNIDRRSFSNIMETILNPKPHKTENPENPEFPNLGVSAAARAAPSYFENSF